MTSTEFRGTPTRQSFRDRLEGLRNAWQERREVRPLAAARDFASQRAVLDVLYRWCEDAAALIGDVYGEEIAARVEPLPGDSREFSVSVGDGPALVFSLVERDGGGGEAWTVLVRLSAPATAVETQRRNGPWSRVRLEQLLLSVIAAHERARLDAGQSGGASVGGKRASSRM